MPVSPGFQSTTRPATSTLAVQPQPRVSSVSGTAQVLQRPLSGCPSPQEAAKSSAGLSQPVGRPATAPSLSRNLSIPVLAQSASRPVATVTAQPVTFNRVDLVPSLCYSKDRFCLASVRRGSRVRFLMADYLFKPGWGTCRLPAIIELRLLLSFTFGPPDWAP